MSRVKGFGALSALRREGDDVDGSARSYIDTHFRSSEKRFEIWGSYCVGLVDSHSITQQAQTSFKSTLESNLVVANFDNNWDSHATVPYERRR